MAEPERAGLQGWFNRRVGEDDSAGWPVNSFSGAFESFRVIKNGPGTLFNFSGFNSNTGAQFILLFDGVGQPSVGTPPILPVTAAASQNFSGYFPPYGRAFTRGIVIANSASATAYTAGVADCWFDAQYE